ncbi:MAG: AgmX/PglI C-terminal domain-containing protein [Bradymonadales bacterium]|nr:AgmX/PglI C-terminal domain-containing protein [Bradymonadales bacterium]
MMTPKNLILAAGLCFLVCTPTLLSHVPRARAQGNEGAGVVLDTSTVPDSLDLIPLTHLTVRGQISGSIAEVEVEQVYENHFEQRIEAVYVFPLPNEAAVNEMIMVIGERRIRADLREREEARQAYEAARDRGQTASLLEQERPNIFTMNVANIEPGQPIRVLVRYVQQIPYRDGRYHFHHPTVVGPRFIPGSPTGHEGIGLLPDTDQVPDASRITPAVLPEGVRTPYEVEFDLTLEAGMAIRDLESSSHDLTLRWENPSEVSIELPESERQPNRDIQFSYALAEGAPEVGLLTYFDEEQGGFFSLMVEPPVQLDPGDIRPKEMFFVLDTSGSMHGHPIETSKAVMRYALEHMNPDDTFQIITFDDSTSSLSPQPLSNTPRNVRRGLRFVDRLQANGGTNMIAGVRAALEPAPDGDRMRIVLFLTDGYIGNESAILSLVNSRLGQTRIFSLGVGSSVNRFLLDSLAQVGRGTVHYVNIGEAVEQVVETFYGRIHNPILTDISLDWEGLQVDDVIPDPICDLFAGVPLQLTGRFSQTGRGTLTVRGLVGTRPVQFDLAVDLTAEETEHAAIPTIWARRQVEALESRVFHSRDQQTRQQVIELALQFNLMTQYTSFVAIEEKISVNASDPLRTVGVPVALPAGVSDALIGPQVVQVAQQDDDTGTGRGGTSANRSRSRGPARYMASSEPPMAGLVRPVGAVSTETMRLPVAETPSNSPDQPQAPAGGGTEQIDAQHQAQSPAAGIDGHQVAIQPEPDPSEPGQGGDLSQEIRVALEQYRPLFRACYLGALPDGSDLEGIVRISITIGINGAVEKVEILENTTGSTDLEECLKASLEHLTFASRPAEPTEVTHTWTFPL